LQYACRPVPTFHGMSLRSRLVSLLHLQPQLYKPASANLRPTGTWAPSEPLVCTDDSEAIEKAERLVDGHDIELLSGARLVKRLEATEKPDGEAVSDEIKDGANATAATKFAAYVSHSSRYQGRSPTEIVLNAQCLHYDRNGENADDLHQRSSRKHFYKYQHESSGCTLSIARWWLVQDGRRASRVDIAA
jgi:hypothetical protein